MVFRKESMAARTDRRVERTRQLIRAAFRSLLEEKGYETVTVQDIIDRANVGRATFYAHFDNKDELFASGFDELRASLKALQRAALLRGADLGERVFAFSEEMFAHANQYRNVFQAMVGKQSGVVVQRLLHKLLVDLVRDDVKAASGRGATSAVAVDAVAQFIAGGLFGLLVWWLNARPRLSATEMNALFRILAMPALAAGAK
jgi:AcrR family transcriptional regulator